MSDTEEKPDQTEGNNSRKAQKEKKKFDFERNSRTIFVGNLPASYDHREVAKLFKQCGPVESARIRSVVPDKEKLAPKVAMITKRIHPKVDSVNAYVVFEHNNDDVPLKKSLKLNGKLIDGHHIRVDRAIVPNAKRMTLTSRKKSIFVGNLRFDIRDDDLINHFNKVGPVNYVRIVRDRATGLGKGFGFVVFQERASVKKALELNETDFKGRSLRIKKVEEDNKKNADPKDGTGSNTSKSKQKKKEKEKTKKNKKRDSEDSDFSENDFEADSFNNDEDDEDEDEEDTPKKSKKPKKKFTSIKSHKGGKDVKKPKNVNLKKKVSFKKDFRNRLAKGNNNKLTSGNRPVKVMKKQNFNKNSSKPRR